MPWPPKCSPKVVQCSVCGAENAHPGSNGVHLCHEHSLGYLYFCKHCGKQAPSGTAYYCPKCNGLLGSNCHEVAQITKGITDESGFVGGPVPYTIEDGQPTDKEEPDLGPEPAGKIEAIKHVALKTGWSIQKATKLVGKYQSWEYAKLVNATAETLNNVFGGVVESKQGKASLAAKQTSAYKAALEKKEGKEKKLPKGFVTHGMASKPQHLFHPSKSQQQVFSEWELEPMLDLTQAAADYYLLVLMDSLQWTGLGDVNIEKRLKVQVDLMDTQFQRYLHMAVGGELRHARGHYKGPWTKFPPEIVGLFKGAMATGGRHDAWHVWKAFVETHGWEKTASWAAQVFNAGHWSSSFGGKNWGNVATTLHQRLKGAITPLVFIDMTLGLQHNTGCVFNKKVGWSYSGLQKVLDAGRIVDLDKPQPMQVLVDYASDSITNMLEQVLEKYVKGEVG